MKDFKEFVIAKTFENVASQMGSAFVGGALQATRGQRFDPQSAIKNPLQRNTDQQQQIIDKNPRNPYEFKQHYQKFLTSQDQKSNALRQWFNQRPDQYYQDIISRHYSNNPLKFNQDLQSAMQSWQQDQNQGPATWDQYLQNYLRLPRQN